MVLFILKMGSFYLVWHQTLFKGEAKNQIGLLIKSGVCNIMKLMK